MQNYEEWEHNDGYSRNFDNMAAVESANAVPDVLSVRDGVPMQLNIMTQDIMDMNIRDLKLREVTNQANFENGNIPTIGGLFSEYIFGTTQDERKKTWGYIEMGTKVFHPYIYEVLVKIQQNIDDVCAGNGVWKIDAQHQLVRASSKDPDYNPENTGIDWFISVYPQIKFKRNKSRERNERLDFIETFKPGEELIHTWMVMPPFLRDVEFRDGPPRVPEINNLYSNVIRYSNALKQESIGFMSNNAKYNLQKNLVAIRRHFQPLMEKSKGFLHQHVLGKNPDYGSRSVISCAVLDQYDKPEDDPIDMQYSGIPLAQVCAMAFPFVQRWVHNFLENWFSNTNKIIVRKDNNAPEIPGTVIRAELNDPMGLYTQDYIKKKINNWLNTYEDRFETIIAPLKDGTNVTLLFTGRPYATDPDNIQASTISKRALTWTDLLYMAAVEVTETKAVWITRYPAVGHMSTFPTMIHVLSTIKTLPVMVDGRVYPHYPVVDPKMPRDLVARSFNDTITMSNMYLAAINGDYDGDTVSTRITFLEESSEESISIINSPKQYLDAQGKLVRITKNESFLMLYNLTRTDPNAGKADDITKGKFLALKPEEIGIKKLAELFGTNYNKNTKEFSGPKYNVTTKVFLKAGEYTNKTDVNTTLGKLVFNKILIEPYLVEVVPNGYVNDDMTSKVTKKFFDFIGNELLYERITVDKLWPFLRAFEFYTTKGVTIFSPSYTSNMLIPKKSLLDEKEKFFKEHPNATIDEIVKMEDNLVAKATAMIENDPGYPIFASDARGSVADNYKMMAIFTGPVLNPITGEWDKIESDFVSGFKKEELATAGNMLINAQYPKSVATQDSGYVTKQFNAVFQAVRVDEDGTDCHTKSYITMTITPENWKLFEFQNMVIGDRLEVLEEGNKDKYLNKPIKFRSPMCCTANIVCSVCAGRRPYKLGLKNIGLQFSNLSNDLLEKSMKKFHDSKVQIHEVDVNSLLL